MKTPLRLPVVSLAAEHLVMGHLMRRNILTYKAPPQNEGYDLICIHPDPRRKGTKVIRVQVKSRYQSDSDRGFPVKHGILTAFDFLVVCFLNIGEFYRGRDGSSGARVPEFFTFPAHFVRKHHRPGPKWEKVELRGLNESIQQYKDELGFEQIAAAIGIERPRRSG